MYFNYLYFNYFTTLVVSRIKLKKSLHTKYAYSLCCVVTRDIHILNHHDPGTALEHNSFALAVS